MTKPTLGTPDCHVHFLEVNPGQKVSHLIHEAMLECLTNVYPDIRLFVRRCPEHCTSLLIRNRMRTHS